MSDWSPCKMCKDSAIEGSSVRTYLCNDCHQARMAQLVPIFRDRAYRAHLVRRVLGSTCPINCPESPSEHATFDYNCLDENGTKAMYVRIIEFASAQFERTSDDRLVTAFEVLVGENEVEGISYCPDCLTNAQRKLELNELIQLCGLCLNKRNTHIENTYQSQHHFHEPWQVFRFLSVIFWDDVDVEGDGIQNDDYYIELAIFEQIGGGGTTETLQAIQLALTTISGLSATCASIFFAQFQKSHNDRMYQETVHHNNRMFNETIRNNTRMEDLTQQQVQLALVQHRESRENDAHEPNSLARQYQPERTENEMQMLERTDAEIGRALRNQYAQALAHSR